MGADQSITHLVSMHGMFVTPCTSEAEAERVCGEANDDREAQGLPRDFVIQVLP